MYALSSYDSCRWSFLCIWSCVANACLMVQMHVSYESDVLYICVSDFCGGFLYAHTLFDVWFLCFFRRFVLTQVPAQFLDGLSLVQTSSASPIFPYESDEGDESNERQRQRDESDESDESDERQRQRQSDEWQSDESDESNEGDERQRQRR